MITRYAVLCAGAFLATIALQSESAHALSMQECSAKYKAAKDAGTLNGMKWNDFRKAQCGAEAAAAPPTPAARPAPTAAPSAATGNARPFRLSIQASLPERRVCTPVSINTAPIRRAVEMTLSGLRKVAAITASATNDLKSKAKTL
jgi:hypothetical protein